MIARLLPYRFWLPRTMVAGIFAVDKKIQGFKVQLQVKASLIIAGLCVVLPFCLAVLQPVNATVGINNTINFQGKVTNADGTNVTDGTYDFVFKLYNGASSGSTNTFTESWTAAALWSSTMTSAPAGGGESLTYSSNTNESTIQPGQMLWNTTKKESVKVVAVNTSTNVITISPTKQAWATSDTVTNKIYVQSGLFSVALNSLNQDAAWGTTDFNTDQVYLGVNFNSDGEMKPRIQFTTVPYAKNAQKVNGLAVTNTSGNPTANGTTLKIADNKTVTFNNGLAFSGVDGKTVTFNNTLTLSGTDGSSIAFGTGGTVCYTATGCNQANTNTGSGTAGQLAFYTGTNTQSSDAGLAWDNTNKRLGIGGVSNPAQALEIKYGNIQMDTLGAPSAPLVATGAAGSLTGAYIYEVTYVTAYGETQGGSSSATVNPSGQQVNLTNISTDSSGNAIARKIYRTTAGGSIFYYVATINDNVTTTYTDNTADGSLGSRLSPDNTTGGLLLRSGSRVFMATTNSTAVGYLSLNSNSAIGNTAIGVSSLTANTSGYYNSGLGYESLKANTTGVQNTASGYRSLYSNVTGQDNTGLGYATLFYNTASYNTAIGSLSLSYNTTGHDLTGLGYGALNNNTTGNYNIGIGSNALSLNSSGTNNIGIGYQALQNMTTGFSNIAIGTGALGNLKPSGSITSFAANGGNTTVTSNGHSLWNGINITISGTTNYNGTYSISNVTTNTFDIAHAFVANDATGTWDAGINGAGSYNTVLGYQAGQNNKVGYNNVFIGYQAGQNETGSYKLYIDDSNTSSPLIYGDFYTNALKINGTFEATGATKLDNYTTTGGLLYTDGSGNISQLGAGTTGQCLTANTSAAASWGSCGNTIMSQGSGFAYLTSSSDGVVFGGSTTTAGDFWFDTANANLYLGVDALKNGGLTFRSSGSSITDASITTNSVGDLILSAPSGNVALGSGTGNITMSLTNATDLFKADKTLTLSGALSSTDFTYTRNLTAGANAAGGAVFKINDTSTGSSTINPDMLVVDAHPASGTFSGNLLRLENGGTDKFVVNSSGNVTTGGTYNGLTISSTTGTLTLASGKTLTVNNSLTFSGTDSTSFTLPTTGGNLATSAATSTQIAFSTGTGTLSGDSNLTWDNTNKRLGVGGTPTDALDVNGLIRVRNPQGETAAPTRANNGEFAFANVSSTQRLYFQANGTASYINASGSGDYSEFFLKTYPQESLVPGMVIGAEQGNVTKTTRHQTALGVVSAYGTRNFDDNADGQRGEDARYINVGLLGQLPVIVSTEQGAIAAGDQLGTNSLFQGVAAHFTGDDSAVVGMAQQPFNPDTTQCQAASSVEAIAWPKLANNQLPDNDQCFRLPNNVIVGKVMAYIHPASTGLTAPTPTISSSSQLALQQLSAGANGLTIATNLTVNGDLTVSGNLTVSKGLAVGGPAEFQGPAIFKAVADFFDSVVFHKDATFQQNVSFAKSPTFNHDTAGSAIIRLGMQSVHVTFDQPFAAAPVVSTTLNSGPLRTDSYQSYLNANICTVAEGPSGCETKLKAKLLSTDVHFVVSDQDANGFTVELDKPAQQDLKFNWTAIQVKDVTETVSTPTPTPTP